jgi:hypothetical protein
VVYLPAQRLQMPRRRRLSPEALERGPSLRFCV